MNASQRRTNTTQHPFPYLKFNQPVKLSLQPCVKTYGWKRLSNLTGFTLSPISFENTGRLSRYSFIWCLPANLPIFYHLTSIKCSFADSIFTLTKNTKHQIFKTSFQKL